METTQNHLTPYAQTFFDKLKSTLNTKLYFFGSVQRSDYFPKSSDIDVDIFTDNMQSTLYKLQSFLNVNRSKFKPIIIKLSYKNHIIHGYKIYYQKPEQYFATEFSIYDEKYKDDILYEHNSRRELPFVASILLVIIKFLYYELNIFPKFLYKKCKEFILCYLIFRKENDFIVM
jgi:hypothetical protein